MMPHKSNTQILLEYVNTVKPFHTKIIEFSENYESNTDAAVTTVHDSIVFDVQVGFAGLGVVDELTIIRVDGSSLPKINAFIVEGDQTPLFDIYQRFTVLGSTSNDGSYQVFSASYNGTETTITTFEPIQDDALFGAILYRLPLNINFGSAGSQSFIHGGAYIQPTHNIINVGISEEFTVEFEILLQDDIHVYNMENKFNMTFGGLPTHALSSPTPPSIPYQSAAPVAPNLHELWYDNSDPNYGRMKRWEGSAWVDALPAHYFNTSTNTLYRRVWYTFGGDLTDTNWETDDTFNPFGVVYDTTPDLIHHDNISNTSNSITINGGDFSSNFQRGTSISGYDNVGVVGVWVVEFLPIVSTSTSAISNTGSFEITGDITAIADIGDLFNVGVIQYTIFSTVFGGTNTIITVVEPVSENHNTEITGVFYRPAVNSTAIMIDGAPMVTNSLIMLEYNKTGHVLVETDDQVGGSAIATITEHITIVEH